MPNMMSSGNKNTATLSIVVEFNILGTNENFVMHSLFI